jgi:hypothetical protein
MYFVVCFKIVISVELPKYIIYLFFDVVLLLYWIFDVCRLVYILLLLLIRNSLSLSWSSEMKQTVGCDLL